jgi:hypothetical protein
MAVSQWYKGFSRQSDNDGLVRVKLVDEYMANESPAIKAKIAQRVMSEPAYRAVRKWGDGSVPAAIVEEKAYRNLSQRYFVIFGQGFSYAAMGFKVTPGNPVFDFNSPPEAQKKAANVWERSEIFEETHPLGPAWCTDWNPATGTPEWWLEKVKERVAQIKAAPGGSSGFGVK